MSKAVFYGFSAWVGRISGLTTCDWWATDPVASGFPAASLVSVDLAMNTSAVRAKQIALAQLQVDDHRIDGGLTTIGPRWPSGSTIGACWVASTYYDQLAAGTKPVRISGLDGQSDYEYTSFQYFDGEQGNRRFYGFYAIVTAVSTSQPALTQVQVWNPGSAHQGTPAGTWWLDLAAVSDPSGTAIGPVGSSGAVFLDSTTVQSLKLAGPKQPPFMGGFQFPGRAVSRTERSEAGEPHRAHERADAMIAARVALSRPQVSMISKTTTTQGDPELHRIHQLIDGPIAVAGRGDLEEALGHLLACDAPQAPRTLDLIGHSSPGASLLTLGDWVIDDASPTVTAFFRELADHDVLPRLGVTAIRLLGCTTAVTPRGRATICALAEILGIEVCGTTGLVYSAHYAAAGFADEWRFLLVGSSELRGEQRTPARVKPGQRYPRVLDIDALPIVAIDGELRSWPRRVATAEAARSILRLVRRAEGASMPGLLATPSCELALPAAAPGGFHIAQILLDGAFVRVYPAGDDEAGVMFPVDNPYAVTALVAGLPTASPAG